MSEFFGQLKRLFPYNFCFINKWVCFLFVSSLFLPFFPFCCFISASTKMREEEREGGHPSAGGGWMEDGHGYGWIWRMLGRDNGAWMNDVVGGREMIQFVHFSHIFDACPFSHRPKQYLIHCPSPPSPILFWDKFPFFSCVYRLFVRKGEKTNC